MTAITNLNRDDFDNADIKKSIVLILYFKFAKSKNRIIEMGACQTCENNQDLPDISRIAQSRAMSTGDTFIYQNPLAGRSQMLSESMIYSNIYKVASIEDSRISNKIVKSRLKSMPASGASRRRNILQNQQQIQMTDLGAIYYGEIDEGLPNGYGKLFFQNHDYLEGQFVQGRCSGQGRFIKADGSYYDGDIKNNVADGYGLFIGMDNYKYQGQWKQNLPNGQGDATYPNGTRYVGQFFNGKKHGKGTLYENQNTYSGDFLFDQIEGELLFTKQNGDTYDGQWKNNQKHGYGRYEWNDGTCYEGEYEKGRRHGVGKMAYSNGGSYCGSWLQGEKHGKGEFKSQKQNFHGYWKKGKLAQVIQ